MKRRTFFIVFTPLTFGLAYWVWARNPALSLILTLGFAVTSWIFLTVPDRKPTPKVPPCDHRCRNGYPAPWFHTQGWVCGKCSKPFVASQAAIERERTRIRIRARGAGLTRKRP